LLLRSAEGKPPSTRFVYNTLHSSLVDRAPKEVLERRSGLGSDAEYWAETNE